MPRCTCKYLNAGSPYGRWQRGSPSESVIWTPMAVMVFSWSITNPGIMPATIGLGLGVSGWVLGHAPGAYRTFLPRVMGEEKDCPGSPLGLGRSLPPKGGLSWKDVILYNISAPKGYKGCGGEWGVYVLFIRQDGFVSPQYIFKPQPSQHISAGVRCSEAC